MREVARIAAIATLFSGLQHARDGPRQSAVPPGKRMQNVHVRCNMLDFVRKDGKELARTTQNVAICMGTCLRQFCTRGVVTSPHHHTFSRTHTDAAAYLWIIQFDAKSGIGAADNATSRNAPAK